MIELPIYENISILEEKNYEYLEILEADTIRQKSKKTEPPKNEKTSQKPKFCSRNRIKLIKLCADTLDHS